MISNSKIELDHNSNHNTVDYTKSNQNIRHFSFFYICTVVSTKCFHTFLLLLSRNYLDTKLLFIYTCILFTAEKAMMLKCDDVEVGNGRLRSSPIQ